MIKFVQNAASKIELESTIVLFNSMFERESSFLLRQNTPYNVFVYHCNQKRVVYIYNITIIVYTAVDKGTYRTAPTITPYILESKK